MIRRAALVVTFLLFLGNLAVLGWIKTVTGNNAKFKFQVIVDRAETLNKVKSKLEGEGYTVTGVSGDKMERMVPDGYKVVLTNSDNDVELLKSILATLKHEKFPAKIVGSEIQVGGVYKTEKQAQAMQAKVAKYGLKVAEHAHKANVKVTKLNVEVDGMDKVNELKKEMKELNIPDTDVSAEPVQPS